MKILRGCGMLGISAIALASTHAQAAPPDCERFFPEGHLQIIGPLVPGPDPIAVGTVHYVFAGGARDGLGTAFLVEPPKFGEDGTLHATFEVIADLGNGDSITWRTQQVHSPTQVPGENDVNERFTMIAGTGIFAGSFGRGTGHGTSSLNTFTSDIYGKAFICSSTD